MEHRHTTDGESEQTVPAPRTVSTRGHMPPSRPHKTMVVLPDLDNFLRVDCRWQIVLVEQNQQRHARQSRLSEQRLHLLLRQREQLRIVGVHNEAGGAQRQRNITRVE